MCQSNYFQYECCSITCGRAVMCELNLVKVQCVTVKLLSILLVTFFAFRTLQTVPSDLSLRRQLIEIIVFCTERRKSCFQANSLVALLLGYITTSEKRHNSLDGMQLRPETNNEINFLHIRLCFINVYTYTNSKPTPHNKKKKKVIVVVQWYKNYAILMCACPVAAEPITVNMDHVCHVNQSHYSFDSHSLSADTVEMSNLVL